MALLVIPRWRNLRNWFETQQLIDDHCKEDSEEGERERLTNKQVAGYSNEGMTKDFCFPFVTLSGWLVGERGAGVEDCEESRDGFYELK